LKTSLNINRPKGHNNEIAMKKTVIILSTVALLLATIRQVTKKQEAETNNILPTNTIETVISDINLDKKEHTEDTDSLILAEILTEALKIATQNINKETFFTKYEATLYDEYDVKVEISLDYHFTKDYSHLIIRRSNPNSVCIDIFFKNNGIFERVVSHEQWALTYVGDTIQDINGDGLKDFVVNWYGATGCCLKAFSNVYLLRPDKKSFSNEFEFINPTFSPKEKIIRGVCYGHPGETEMYKYKWNDEKIDTLEYVYYEKNKNGNKTGKIIISTNGPWENNNKVLKRLNYVPNEYTKIEGYWWFEGNIRVVKE